MITKVKFDPNLIVYKVNNSVTRYKAYYADRMYSRIKMDRIMLQIYNIKSEKDIITEQAHVFHAKLKFHTVVSKKVTKPWIIFKDTEWEYEYPIGLNEFENLLKLENSSVIKYPDFSWECDWYIGYKAGYTLVPLLKPIKEKNK